ncbi:MAG: hypothetical protein A3A10_01760 [Candidatus Tagabacteria bacterium RIFCSPLOWO2_01_FULL_42_9]|uniref:VTT domain-containing protein n=1 Tax=Candidatus Tagabacteria bacterium RIFCSPLOWO2_01_FULL_42_9 TaxID=1802296 RepID=A0A1G2LW91_9BACT|nr:MAG: hypothetical protein A3A10_01760 [Candidatus Tagabacteria bacterium RIFCSPLOWO2_01_FULL_42_9]
MELFSNIVDFFLHFDRYLGAIIQSYGALTYAIISLVIFCETGLVVTPFLPGDSLLFAAGTFSASGALNIKWLFTLLGLAAILGNIINYHIGRFMGPKVFYKENSRIFNKHYLKDAQKFYEKYGAKTIIITRFMPFVRTFAPFVAGIGKMTYWKFMLYNIIGGISWISFFLLGGYYFGNMLLVKKNFSLVVLAIIAISLLPLLLEFFKRRRENPRANPLP